MIVRDYIKQKADKIKEEKNQLKLKEKEELQKVKDEAKQKAKEAKLKEKEEAKAELKKSVQLAKQNKKKTPVLNDNTIVIDLTNENVVISCLSEAQNVVTNAVTNAVANNDQVLLCHEILKTGKNKGTQCGNKVFENNLCKRHINKQLPTNI